MRQPSCLNPKPQTSASALLTASPVQRSSGKGWGLPLRYPSLDGSPLPSARGSGSLPTSARIRASQGACPRCRLFEGGLLSNEASGSWFNQPLLAACYAQSRLACCFTHSMQMWSSGSSSSSSRRHWAFPSWQMLRKMRPAAASSAAIATQSWPAAAAARSSQAAAPLGCWLARAQQWRRKRRKRRS